VIDETVAKQIRAIIDAEPVAGLRMIVARVRRTAPVNRKKIHRIVKLNGWQVRQRPQGHRPRVQGWASRATRPNERWAIDTTHLFTQQDGWCHLTALIDCCDRTIVGWRLARSGIAGVAAAALEDALRTRQIIEQNVSTRRLVESKLARHALLGPLAAHLKRCLKLSVGSGVAALTSPTATLLGAVQLDAGPPLNGPHAPREVRELRKLFACRPVFMEAALLLGIAGAVMVKGISLDAWQGPDIPGGVHSHYT